MVLNNEKGNTTVFIVGSFSILLLLFVIVASFGNIFIFKEKASNNAEMASIAATGVIFEYLQEAIDEYDASLTPEEYPILSVNEKVRVASIQLRAAHPDWATVEVKHTAINQVLKGELPVNIRLRGFVEPKLQSAAGEAINTVRQSIESNEGVVEGTKIKLNQRNRLEVETAANYKAASYDKYFPDDKRKVKQKGEGPKLDFVDGLGSWSINEQFN